VDALSFFAVMALLVIMYHTIESLEAWNEKRCRRRNCPYCAAERKDMSTHEEYEPTAYDFIGDNCECEHDASAHRIIEDADERGRYSWLECDDCIEAGTECQK